MLEEFTVFYGPHRVGGGSLADAVAAAHAKNRGGLEEPLLVFENLKGRVVDLDLRGELEQVQTLAQMQFGERPSREAGGAGGAEDAVTAASANLGTQARSGRPKLGVVPREVTLLPRHWEWLATQPEGASAVLRRLVETARKENAGKDRQRLAGEAVYRFMSAVGGDLHGYEEASRAFYRRDEQRLELAISQWPPDLAQHLRKLVNVAWEQDA